MKRIISLLLSVCLILGLFPVTVKADDVQKKYLKVSVNEEVKTYECLWNNEEIYCSIESLAEISNYAWNQIDDGLDYYFFKEYGELDNYSAQPVTDVNISVDKNKEKAYVEAMDESYTMDCYFVDEELFLPLEKLLYLLHVGWSVENDTVDVTPMPLTILDFIAIHGIDLIEIATQSEEVLINTGWILSDTQFGQAVYSSIAEVFSDFDGKIFMFWLPGEGHVETAESYENAILQLAREDEEFITENIQQDALESAVDSAFYLHNNYMSKIQNIMAIPENIDDIVQSVPDAVELLEDMGKEVPKLKKIAEDIKDGKIDTLFLSNPELKATTKQLEQIGDGIAIMQCVWNVYDTATRVQGWDKEYLAQLQILADYQEFSCINESIANYVREAAQRLIDSYNAPSEAAADEALQSTVGLLLSKTFDASPFGKAFSIMNAVGSCYGVYNADFADTYDMYAELSNVSFSVKVEQMVKYLLDYNHLFNSTEKLTNEKLEEYRNQLMLYLRLNLRNKVQLYNLNIKGNEDKNWVQSKEANELYDEIVLVYVMLAELIETKEYDPFVVLESNLDNMYGELLDELYLKDVVHVPISSEILLNKKAVVSVDWEAYSDADGQYGVIKGLDENKEVVWSYTTKKCIQTELDAVKSIGSFNEKYYFVEDGSIIALNLFDGSVAWKNDEFGGDGVAFTLGKNGELYICGYYGPDFFAVDVNGKTIKKIEQFSEKYWWPYKIECVDNTVFVTFEGGEDYFKEEITYMVNLTDFSYTLSENDKQTSNYESSSTYDQVIAKYATAMKESWDMSQLDDAGLNYICADYTNEQIGYTYIDIDSNGVEELIIGSTDSKGYIFDMYTIIDSEIKQVLSSMERDSYYLSLDGSIINDGSGSAIETGFRRYVIGPDGYTLKLVEGVVYDGYYAEEIGLVNDISECSEDNSYFKFSSDEKYIHISAQEAQQRRNAFMDKANYMDLECIPFSEYK